MKTILLLVALLSMNSFAKDFTPVQDLNDVQSLKSEIIKIAEYYTGQGDPDFKIQKTLDPYVDKLTDIAPQAPIDSRIDILAGKWQQVWGPYEYRTNARGVDPSFDTKNIYQVVSEDGYYWNVGLDLNKRTKKVKKITLLRGEYQVSEGNDLKIRFTRLKSLKPKRIPEGLNLTDLPELAETNDLPGMRTTLPNFFVKLFFGSGTLTEVYTDEDLRLAYGTSNQDGVRGFLYVMKRVD